VFGDTKKGLKKAMQSASKNTMHVFGGTCIAKKLFSG
jgi:hypothetical protein